MILSLKKKYSFRNKISKRFLLLFVLLSAGYLGAQPSFTGSETRANTTTTNSQQNPSVAVDTSGKFVAVWESYLTDGSDYGIYAQLFNADGSVSGSEFVVNTTTTGGQRLPSVACDAAGNFVVVWQSYNQDGDGWGVYQRFYSASGSAITGEVLVNATSAGDQKYPHVSMNSAGQFMVTWTSGDANDMNVYGRCYDNSASATSGEVQINTFTTDFQGYSKSAIRENGEAIVVWQSNGQDNNGNGIYAQLINSTGTLIGSEFIINTDSSGNQQEPDVDVNIDGNYVVVWSSYNDGDREGIYAQRLDSMGQAQDTAFRVNTTTAGTQMNPSVCLSDSGYFTISWNSYGQDSSYDGVYLQAYNPIGGVFGTETAINTTTTDFQQFPDVAVKKNGSDIVVVWQDGQRSSTSTHDGSDYGVYYQVLSVADTVPPVASCIGSITLYLDASGQASILPDSLDNGTTDNSGAFTLSLTDSSFTCFDIGLNTVYFIATDAYDNADTCTMAVTVLDTISPTVVCQNIAVYLDGSGNASITASDLDGGSTDNCSSISLSASQTAFTCADIGANSVTLTATDGSGNTSNCAATVTVADTTSPTVVCQNITVYLDGSGNASITASDLDGGSTDNCSSPTLSASQTAFTCSDVGAVNVTLTATDGSGNTSNCTAVVTVADTTSPTVVCQNITVYLDGGGNASITASDLDGGSTDNCSSPTLSASQTAFTCADIVTMNVTLTATDGSGNTSNCAATVIVADTTSPTVVCQNITVYLDGSGNASITANDLDGGSTDNCSSPTLSASQTAFTCSDAGAVNVTLVATDGSGNTAICTATVTVMDTVAPAAVCQNTNLYLDNSGTATLNPSDIDAGSNDGCSAISYSVSQSSYDCSMLGSNNVILTVTDGSGNAASCSSIVTVLDTISPTAVCVNYTLVLDSTGNGTLSAGQVDGGSSDNCSIATYAVSPSSFTGADVGNNSVVLTVTDVSGNVSTCTAMVTVSDTSSVSIVKHGEENEMNWLLIPNPAQSSVTIKGNLNVDRSLNECKLIITDMYGKIIHLEKIPVFGGTIDKQLDINAYATGVYQVSIEIGSKLYTQRLIKIY